MKMNPENIKKAQHLMGRKEKAQNALAKDAVRFAGIRLVPFFDAPDAGAPRGWPPQVPSIEVEEASPFFKAVLAAYLKEAKREAAAVDAEMAALDAAV